jgi:RNA polymerase sigma factor (sigma-70 family)
MPATAVAEPQRHLVPCAPALPPVTGHTHDVEGPDRELVSLVRRAAGGDERAWERLYDHFTPTMRAIARGYRLSASDVDDVMQAVWLCLLKHIGRLREPLAIGGWLATTTRRECLRLLQRPLREYSTDDPGLGEVAQEVDPAGALIAAERHAILHRALDTLPERHRLLMLALVSEPPMAYRQISASTSIPCGSIGPIRSRSLARLQRHPALRALSPIAGETHACR